MVARPFGRGRRQREEQLRALRHGDLVQVPCRLRRTSARGWGPWAEAVLTLGVPPGGDATWHVDDPVAVGLPVTRGPVDATLAEIDELWLRAVRFRTEAFWGMDAEIVVLQAERATTEVACDPLVTDAVAARLRELLDLPDAAE